VVAAGADVGQRPCALNKETRGLLGTALFRGDAEGRVFRQRARSRGVVDQEALRRAMRRKVSVWLWIVYPNEPTGSTGEFADPSLRRFTGPTTSVRPPNRRRRPSPAETVRIVRTFKETGKVPNVVNLAKSTPVTCTLVVRHLDRPGVLASVLDAISGARINVQEMENIVFDGAQAAVARINLESEPSTICWTGCAGRNSNILELSVIRINDLRDTWSYSAASCWICMARLPPTTILLRLYFKHSIYNQIKGR